MDTIDNSTANLELTGPSSVSQPNLSASTPLILSDNQQTQTSSLTRLVSSPTNFLTSPLYSMSDSDDFSLPKEGSYYGSSYASRHSNQSVASFGTAPIDTFGGPAVDEGGHNLLHAAKELWLSSILNRVLALYYAGRYERGLSLIDEAYYRQEVSEDPSLFCRVALWRALILEKMELQEDMFDMLSQAIVLSQDLEKSSDQKWLLKMLEKYAIDVANWLKTNHPRTNPDTFQLEMTDDIVQSVFIQLKEKYWDQQGLASPDHVNATAQDVCQPHLFEIHDLLLDSKHSRTLSSTQSDSEEMVNNSKQQPCTRCIELHAENQALKRRIACTPVHVDPGQSSTPFSTDSFFRDLHADTQVNRSALPLEYRPSSQDTRTRSDDSRSRNVEQVCCHGHGLPRDYRPRLRELDCSYESNSDGTDGADDGSSVINSLVEHNDIKEHLDNEMLHQPLDVGWRSRSLEADIDAVRPKSKERDLKDQNLITDERDLTDTPGGAKLDHLVQEAAQRRNSSERRKSLPILITGTEDKIVSHSSKSTVFGIDTTSPVTSSPLRRFSENVEGGLNETEY